MAPSLTLPCPTPHLLFFWVSISLSSSCGKSDRSEMQAPRAYIIAHDCRPFFAPVSFLVKTEYACSLWEREQKVFIRRMTCLSEYVREPCRGRTFHTSSQGKKCNKAWSTAIYRTASVFSCQPSKCWVLGGLKAASLHRVHLTPCTFPLSSASRKVQCWLFPWLSHLYILLFHDSLFSRFK